MSAFVRAGESATESPHYDLIFEKEILCEFSAGLAAAFRRYADANGIDGDDDGNECVKLMREAMLMGYDILSCDTPEAIGAAKNRLLDMKRILSEVSPCERI